MKNSTPCEEFKSSAEYLNSLNHLEYTKIEEELRDYAFIHDVPIIKDEGLALLRQLLMIKNPSRVLEIGSAIGYSALNMARYSNAFIDTIEINPESYNYAVETVNRTEYKDRINLILGDALLVSLDNEYDFIFIDAAKAQYIKFFEKFKRNLKKGGIIFTDNLIFHDLVVSEIHSRNLRQLVRKIKKYNSFVVEQEDFFTYIYNIGDGIAISIKK